MMCRRYSQPLLVAGSLALAVGLAACNSNNGNSNAANRPNDRIEGNADVAGTTGASNQPGTDQAAQTPMTVTGCLQKTGGLVSDYVLTERISTTPVGTKGSSASPGKVESEEEKAAEHSYRLSGNTDNLKNLVGHQIRVIGTLSDRADLPKDKGADSTPTAIKKGDLAQIDVSSFDDVAPNCGARAKK
jgi:hypothetical protein